MKPWPAVRLVLVGVMLAASAWLGVVEGYGSFRDSLTVGQRLCGGLQLLSGGFAGVALVALFVRRVPLRPFLWGWIACVTGTATLAPIVWGGSGLGAGLAAGGATLVVAVLVWFGALAHRGIAK